MDDEKKADVSAKCDVMSVNFSLSQLLIPPDTLQQQLLTDTNSDDNCPVTEAHRQCFSHNYPATTVHPNVDQLSMSQFVRFFSLKLCGNWKNPIGVMVPDIPELSQRHNLCLIGERKLQVKCWRKSPHTTKLLKLLRYPN